MAINSYRIPLMNHFCHSSLTAYYAARGPEHDKIYDQPKLQADLLKLRELLSELLAGRRVLELACGTGYWTRHIAEVARSVLAFDANPDLIRLANIRLRAFSNTALLVDDAFSLSNIEGIFDAGLAAFWWSHIPKLHLPAFLDSFHAKLRPGSLVIFTDFRFVKGFSPSISRTDDEGNTYQLHRLADGTSHEILTNFPTPEELDPLLRPHARLLTLHQFQYIWSATYQLH